MSSGAERHGAKGAHVRCEVSGIRLRGDSRRSVEGASKDGRAAGGGFLSGSQMGFDLGVDISSTIIEMGRPMPTEADTYQIHIFLILLSTSGEELSALMASVLDKAFKGEL